MLEVLSTENIEELDSMDACYLASRRCWVCRYLGMADYSGLFQISDLVLALSTGYFSSARGWFK